MTRYVALLRGINVGGNRRIGMADLRATLESLGHDDVTTLLQSGNALFESPRTDTDELIRSIEKAIDARHGMTVRVLVRTGPELARIVAANPLPEAESEPSRLHVAFLSADPDAAGLASIEASRLGRDVIRPGKRALYVWYRDGAGRSKLTNDFLERRLGVTATSRNWNTVMKLADLVTR